MSLTQLSIRPVTASNVSVPLPSWTLAEMFGSFGKRCQVRAAWFVLSLDLSAAIKPSRQWDSCGHIMQESESPRHSLQVMDLAQKSMRLEIIIASPALQSWVSFLRCGTSIVPTSLKKNEGFDPTDQKYTGDLRPGRENVTSILVTTCRGL
jgi:hypothetical protein